MSATPSDIAGTRALVCDAVGAPLGGGRDATNLVGEAISAGAQMLVIPVERLSPDFLQLSSRVAGEVLQKFVNYGIRTAIVGDISAEVAASTALRDFVGESNRGREVWFVPDLPALEAKLAAG